MQFKASAPGSLMLLGEYAVLYGKHALVCAIDKRVTVTLTPLESDQVEIHSSLYGHYKTALHELSTDIVNVDPAAKPFRFVLTTIKQFQVKIKQGFSLEITTDFSDQVGLGSSAAVTVATMAVLFTWLGIRVQPLDMLRQGRNIVKHVQGGLGSGADVAASVHGGIVSYQAQPLSAEKLQSVHPLTVLYSGHKTPTAEAIQQVQQRFTAHPNLFRELINGLGQCALDGMHVVRKNEWSKLGEIMNIQQGIMEALGVSSTLLHAMVESLRQQPGMIGAKISGSGMGDCVIGLGEAANSYTYANLQRIPATMTLQGVHCEKS
jgi:mevalonate kinase